jgi:rRNA-processing protein FCF1
MDRTLSEKFLENIAKTNPATNVKATVLLDTNVLLEIYTRIDLLTAWHECGSTELALQSPTYRYRQLRARYSTILAWWLAKNSHIVGLLGNEGAIKLDAFAPKPRAGEDATPYVFTTAFAHVIAPFVMPGWMTGALIDVNHAAKGTKADNEILAQAAVDKTPLVTHEGLTEFGVKEDPRKLRSRAKSAGVPAFTAKEYLDAASVDIANECREFVAACHRAVENAQPQNPVFDEFVAEELEPWYRFVLLDEVAPEYAHISRPC